VRDGEPFGEELEGRDGGEQGEDELDGGHEAPILATP
jgi:hypothetical protein